MDHEMEKVHEKLFAILQHKDISIKLHHEYNTIKKPFDFQNYVFNDTFDTDSKHKNGGIGYDIIFGFDYQTEKKKGFLRLDLEEFVAKYEYLLAPNVPAKILTLVRGIMQLRWAS